MSEPLPWDYLSHCSNTSLEAFMLEKMESAARIRKELKVETQRLIETLVAIEVARLLLENGQVIEEYRRHQRRRQLFHDLRKTFVAACMTALLLIGLLKLAGWL